MDPWLWWLAAAGALLAVEVLTLDLFFAMFAGGALAGAAVAGIDAATDMSLGLPVQLSVAIVAALALVFGVRPIAIRHLHQPAELRTGVAALEGSKALVVERVDAHGGLVKLRGEVWTARSYDGTSAYEPGQSVDVVKIEGATALVL